MKNDDPDKPKSLIEAMRQARELRKAHEVVDAHKDHNPPEHIPTPSDIVFTPEEIIEREINERPTKFRRGTPLDHARTFLGAQRKKVKKSREK